MLVLIVRPADFMGVRIQVKIYVQYETYTVKKFHMRSFYVLEEAIYIGKLMRHLYLIVTFIAAVLAASCSQQTPAAAPSPPPLIDQAQLCLATAWERDAVASVCQPGQKVVFLPKSWGDAQLPIGFAAVNCDLRYAVALTEGGVTCIYRPIQATPAGTADQPVPQP